MTMGLACDRDGYDLRVKQCSQCGSRGCPTRDHCKTIPPQPTPRSCERYRRNHGGVPKLNCGICGQGPCTHTAYKDARDVPNRLKGTTINQDGDAT